MKTAIPVDLEITGSCRLDKPYHARMEGRFTSPSGSILRIPAFYDGNDLWKIRFTPTERGLWRYEIESSDVDLKSETKGTLDFSDPEKGITNRLRISPDKRHFLFDNGDYHFMNGYECDWFWSMDLGKDNLKNTEKFLDQIQSHKFNTMVMNVYAHDCPWTPAGREEYTYTPPAHYLWGGTNEEPDHDSMNPAFFDHFDKVMELLKRRGMMVHLFFKVYNKMVNYPEKFSPRDDLYFRYVTARYQAYDNVVWDFSKEAKNEPDKDYILNRINYVKSLDAYKHLITNHDDPGYFAVDERVRSVDFYTDQQHSQFFFSALTLQERYDMPYFNSEFQYEHGPEGIEDVSYGVSQSPEDSVLRAWELVLAGGYPAYYYTYTAWNAIDYRFDPPGTFYFGILYDFITSLKWWEFKTSIELAQTNTCYAMNSGEEELVIMAGLKDRKRDKLLITASWDLNQYEGYWMDVYTGEKIPVGRDSFKEYKRGSVFLTIPLESHTGVLYLKKGKS